VLLVLIPLVSPLGRDYQFVTAALALTLLARRWTDFSRPWRCACGLDLFVIGFSIYDVIVGPPIRAFMAWSVLTLCFLALLAYLASLRSRRLDLTCAGLPRT
jgi:hypothetical protein